MGDRGSLGGKGATGGTGGEGGGEGGSRVGDVVTGFKMEGVETIWKNISERKKGKSLK